MNDRREEFRLLYEAHAARVLAYALRRVPREEAFDVVADTFLVAWRRLGEIPQDAVPWLFSVARRVIANQRRSTRRKDALTTRVETSSTGLLGQPDPADEVTTRVSIVAALDRIPDWDRQALMLVAWEHLDNRRAAAAMGCSRATFAVRLHRARRRLNDQLDAMNEDAPFRALTEEAR